MPLATRKPTGLKPYPCVLITGRPSTGKTFTGIEASASDMVADTYVLTLGEEEPDAFAAIEGADFDLIVHDGTYASIYEQVMEVRALPVGDKPNLFMFDSATKLWNLLLGTAQAIANQRARAAARRQRIEEPLGNAKITGDLWDQLRADWYAIIDAIRTMPGPTIITARLEEQQLFENGVLTSEKAWRIRADPNLPFEVSAVIEMASRGEYLLTKLNDPTAKFAGTRPWPDFTLEKLWIDMGLGEGEVGTRAYTAPRIADSITRDDTGRDWLAELNGLGAIESVRKLGADAAAAHAPQEVLDAIRAKLPAS